MPPVWRRIESRSPSNSGGATQKRKQRLTGAFAAAKGKSAREAFRVASTEVKSTGMSDAPTVQEQLDAFETRLRTAESEVKTSEVKIDALETRNAVLEEQLRKFMSVSKMYMCNYMLKRFSEQKPNPSKIFANVILN